MTVTRALQAAHKAQGVDLDANKAREIGLRTVLELAEDKQEPGSTRGAAARVLLDYAASEGVVPDPITRADWLRCYLKDGRRLLNALALALEKPEAAVRYADKLERRIAAWAAEYEALRPTE